jgi:putative ABC transport system permease protein
MLELALRSLAHDRGKLAAAIAGVAFAATLLFVQIGLFEGFLQTSSALIRRVGGQVWVMSEGTLVLDNGRPLSDQARATVASAPCVARVRGLVVSSVRFKKPSGAVDNAQVIGVEAWQTPRVPWTIVKGFVGDLSAPMRVAVDEHDLDKLGVTGDPIGANVDVFGVDARVAALTSGIRSFALYPYLFTELESARRLARLDPGSANYWIADLEDPACAADVVAKLDAVPGLDAHTTATFEAKTEHYWVVDSGAGAALAFSALFALVVGAVIVGQTLFSITKEHLKELATLKAMGASPREITSFVAWQASFLAVTGGAFGFGLASTLESALSSQGIQVVLSRWVVIVASSAVASMCLLASGPSLHKALTLEAAEVFR